MSKLKGFSIYFFSILIFVSIGWFANVAWNLPRDNKSIITQIKPRPLDKYTIENLSRARVEPSQIEIVKVLKDDPSFTSYEFKFEFDPTLSNGPKKTVSGMLNIPSGKGPFPVIVMFRGFIDSKNYFVGEGTKPSAEVFAKNGYITIAPDFLGYGDSNPEASDVFEARFQTYTTAMVLLKSIKTLKEAPLKVISNDINLDTDRVAIWAHSNGGQIALTTLEITGGTYPTVLWAPVSKPFPYSILFFTDSPGDYGKSLRKVLANFENDYDTDLYSIHNYFDRIKAPIQLNQGVADESVPLAWSDLLYKTLNDLKVDIKYNVYPGADHNMRPAWSQVVNANLNFYQKELQ